MIYSSEQVDRYQNALIREIKSFPGLLSDSGTIETLYFGGGTPSLAPAQYIADLVDVCRGQFTIAEEGEITIEVNPGSISLEKLKRFRETGINRISLGVQSFAEQELKAIGRIHTPDMIYETLQKIRETGFENINVDLMLGLPLQTPTTWKNNIEKIVHLKVPHISIYMLDLDDQCPLKAMVENGSVKIPDEDLIADLYLETIEFLTVQGYQHYEISNFSLPGLFSRHNMKYWTRDPVYGFGLGSHSFDGQSRYSNFSEINDYYKAVYSGASPINWREQITAKYSLEETLFLGLRLTRGVNWRELHQRYDNILLMQYETELREFSQRGLVEWNDSIVRLTPSGMLVSNEIFQKII